ncbi:MAG: ornithine cyclodeaminase, partial [Deltaproteobacteria bacterium]|nr:ornithine cyclodeaminase [Deltaproteobacteria bacterium]
FDSRNAAPLAMILSSTRRGLTKEGVPLRTSDLMTAAISAVGTKWMSRGDSSELLLLGSGKQARNHLLAMKAIRELKRVSVFSPTKEHREEFAEEMAQALKLDVVAVGDVNSAMERADIVLAATNTNVPVFSGAWLREGTHVTSIVGSNVGMVEASRGDRHRFARVGDTGSAGRHLRSSPGGTIELGSNCRIERNCRWAEKRPKQSGGYHGIQKQRRTGRRRVGDRRSHCGTSAGKEAGYRSNLGRRLLIC